MKHIVFEEICGGLTEHALPVIRACVDLDIPVIVGTFPSELGRVASALGDIAGAVDLRVFSEPPSAACVGAFYSSVPNCPGPWISSPRYPAAIPRIAATHGLTDKKTKFPADDPADPLGLFNVVFATGPTMFEGSWQAYRRRYPVTIDAMNVLDIGAPKTDILCGAAFDRDDLLHRFGLNPDLYTVLYSPTYQREASLEKDGCAIINALCSLPINVLVRLHHCSTDLENEHAVCYGHGGKDWRKNLEELQRDHSNLRHVEGDSNPYFCAADLLVGDVSGACYEFLLTGKPIVFVDVPDFFEVHGRDGIGYWGRSCGVTVDDVSDLATRVWEQLSNPARHRADRDAVISRLVFNRGRAAATAATRIRDLIEGSIAVNPAAVERRLERAASRFDIPLAVLRQLRHRRLAVYGAGQHSHMLFAALDETRLLDELEIVRFIDDFPGHAGATFRGIPIGTPEELDPDIVDCIVLSTDKFQNVMTKTCRDLVGADMPVVDLYAGGRV